MHRFCGSRACKHVCMVCLQHEPFRLTRHAGKIRWAPVNDKGGRLVACALMLLLNTAGSPVMSYKPCFVSLLLGTGLWI